MKIGLRSLVVLSVVLCVGCGSSDERVVTPTSEEVSVATDSTSAAEPTNAEIIANTITNAEFDFSGVPVVVHARIGSVSAVDTLPAGENCGYAAIEGTVEILESFKGSLKAGDKAVVGWTIECPVSLDRFGDREAVLFLQPTETTSKGPDWYPVENSDLPVSPELLNRLRDLAKTSD